jgi:hypothetical protein
VVGFYDPDKGRLVYIGSTQLDLTQKFTLAHELTHAIDDQHFKYAGVSGVDKPRIVEVGFNAKYLADLKARVGLGRAVQALLGDTEAWTMVRAPWVRDTVPVDVSVASAAVNYAADRT